MISLFEPAHAIRSMLPGSTLPGSPFPMELLTRTGRDVTLLEFVAVEAFAEVHDRAASEPESKPEFAVDERAAQLAAMIDAAREEAAIEARQQAEAAWAARLVEERERVREVCAAFALDRQRYFAAAETQVVRLALAVARRVLSQESVGTGAHLLPTVRAALARVQDGSASTLRVEVAALDSWRALLVDTDVEVRPDERVAAGECVLETSVGRVELGVHAQMEEIERSFQELMERP